MYQFIQTLGTDPHFVLILIGLLGLLWFGLPQTKWWKRHIIDTFPENYHPKCFECNLGKEACPKCEYKRW